MSIKDHLQKVFLDWFNNFLTIARFAEHYGVDEETASHMIEAGRAIHEQRVRGDIL